MDRVWYARFVFFLGCIAMAWLVLWPSITSWVPAPAWVTDTFERHIALGLDMQGGMQLQYEVEVDEAIIDRRDLRQDQILERLCQRIADCDEDEPASREQLEGLTSHVTAHSTTDSAFRLTFADAEEVTELDRDMVTSFEDLREVARTDTTITLAIRDDAIERLRTTSIEQARETIGNRIDEMGVREASVQVRDNNIVVELPGAGQEDFDRIREIIGRTARLEFKVVDDADEFVRGLDDVPEGIEIASEAVSAGDDHPNVTSYYLTSEGEGARARVTDYVHELQAADRVASDHQLAIGRVDYEDDDGTSREVWRTYYLYSRAEVTGDAIDDAAVQIDPEDQTPNVGITFNGPGARAFERLTGANVHRRMAIVLDDRVETAPVIQARIGGGHARITLGGFRPYQEMMQEASELTVVLRAGALPAPIRPANQQLIGPSLGTDAVADGVFGAIVGICIVLVFMAVYYEVGGVVADIMVLINVLIQMAILAAFEATITLPGIAGIALTVGMAVDANVLINERMREEARLGKSPRAIVEQGFNRAFWSIFDGHVTTFISGVVLYQYGTGPIRGFAVTLMIGIVASLFTGVFCSKIAFDWLTRGLKVTRLRNG